MAAIQLLGHAMGYNSINLIQPKEVHHNMNVLLIGPSTLSRKTTVQDLTRELYPYEKFLPEESTPERFIAELSDDSSRIFAMGEFTGLLKQIKRGSYMSPLVEIMNDLFNCPRRYVRKTMTKRGGKNEFVIENAYLSCISTVTPEMLKQYLDAEMMSGGFLPRWLLSYDEPRPQPRRRLKPDVLQIEKTISFILKEIIRIGEKSPTYFELDDDALERYNEINDKAMKDYPKILPFVGRYMNYVISIADILLVSDAIGKCYHRLRGLHKISEIIKIIKISKLGEVIIKGSIPNSTNSINYTNYLIYEDFIEENSREVIRVPVEYINRAWEIVRPCLDYANELVDYVEMDKPTSKLKHYLEREGIAPVEYSVAMRNTNLSAKEMKYGLETLKDRDEAFVFYTDKKSPKSTRFLQIICLTRNIGSLKCKICKYKEYRSGFPPKDAVDINQYQSISGRQHK